MARFRLSPAARQDIDDIFEFSVQRWGVDQAFRYTDAMVAAFHRFAESPALAQDCSDIRAGYRRGLVGRHYVYFVTDTQGIVVIRVLHQRMSQRARL